MSAILPTFFMGLAALALVAVLFNLWQSLRGVIIGAQVGAVQGARDGRRGPGVPERDALLKEKEELLTAIRDVRFEHELGKVSDDDFQRLDARYRTRAREVLKALDEQVAAYREQAAKLLDERAQAGKAGKAPDGGAGGGSQSPAPGAEAPAKATAAAAVVKQDASADSKPAVRRAEAVSALKCGECGTLNEADANFCKKCAAVLVAP